MSKQRAEFIKKLFERLSNEEYLLLKFHEQDIASIGENADLDIFLPNKNWKLIKQFADAEDTISYMKISKEKFMCQLFLHFEDGGFLQVDCLFELIRKHLIYLPKKELIANQQTKSGVKTYSDKFLFEHLLLFNQLNFSGIPKKYIQHFENLSKEVQHNLLEQVNQKYGFEISSFAQVAEYDESIRQRILKQIKSYPENNWLNRSRNYFSYSIGTVKNLFTKRGFIISFTGVDGAGKSTILEETRQLISEKFRRKTVVLRHRPSLLPILSSYKYGKAGAEKRAATRMPRQGKNKSQFKSLLRFSYYYFDYIVGRVFVFFKYQLRNYIVLYDRYYFDFIVDGKRTNLEMNSDVPKWLYRFVQKPKINFFLYAPAEIILSRKKELTPEAISTLTNNYKNLFDEFSKSYGQEYHSIENIHLDETLEIISQQIKEEIQYA